MNNKLLSALAATSALAFATPVCAGFFDLTLEPYLTASVGQGMADANERYCSLTNTYSAQVVSCDDTDFAYKAGIGLEVNEYIMMEAGYIGFNQFKGSNAGGTQASAEINGVTARMVGTWRLNDSFMFMATGGLAILHTDVKANVAITPAPASVNNVEETDAEWSFGLGAQYNLSKTLGVRAEWERFFSVGDPYTTGESDVDFASVGLLWKF